MFKLIVIGLIITVVGLLAFSAVDNFTASPSSSLNGYSTSYVEGTNMVNVAIDGEINHSGTYSISSEETLGDLIDMAGGVTEKADSSAYLSSLVISTHTSFYIPPVSAGSGVCVDTEFTKVNINTASESQLAEIGFNSAQAVNLIDYRTENGSFEAIEDILKVKGIGEATFSRVKNKIRLS